VIEDVLDSEELVFLRAAIDDIYSGYDPERDGLGHMKGYRFATNLVDKGEFFRDIFLRGPVYDLMKHFLGDDCILSSLNSLEPLQGHGDQDLHRDVSSPPSGGIESMNSLWIIDDIDTGNGATRVVPASHRTDDDAEKLETKPIHVQVHAGSVVVINAHLLHGASANMSGRRRRIMHGFYTKRGNPQQLEHRRFVSPEAQALLSPEARKVLVLDG
jgi:ectoine hydroxylase-related dioxygenase (phytanoyl-CoA dioxygenase family)